MEQVQFYKGTTAGQRHRKRISLLTTAIRPYKNNVEGQGTAAGRNARGLICVRHRGGGNKRRVRKVSNLRASGLSNEEALICTVEKDPSRYAPISLVSLGGSRRKYALGLEHSRPGALIRHFDDEEPWQVSGETKGRLLELPTGFSICSLELTPGSGAKIARAAGVSAFFFARYKSFAIVQLSSGEFRLFSIFCYAILGQIAGALFAKEFLGKAGRARWRGRRPQVRGAAMNPIDHPHGGGEGKAPVGKPLSRTLWGRPAKGVKTGRTRRASCNFKLIKTQKLF